MIPREDATATETIKLHAADIPAVVLVDPQNIRYATGYDLLSSSPFEADLLNSQE